MDKKTEPLKIGLLLTGDYNWAGGLYYVANIIKVLKSYHANSVQIVVFYNNQTPRDILDDVKKLNITLENIDKYNLFLKAIFKIIRIITKRNFQLEFIINPHHLNVIYPLSQYFSDLQRINCTIIYWIYDFQHKFLPHLFSLEEIKNRDKNFEKISQNAQYIVVSSKDALSHFNLFYPKSKSKVIVLPFVSIVNQNQTTHVDLIKDKYGISSPYFVVANQFWIHKNHMVVLQALCLLKNKNIKIKVYFTGKQYDKRNPNYFNEISDFIKKEGITDFVDFTGFIPREDQLALIKNSIAVIQPSKFEGWSTVVEDSKALSKYLLLSNIDVLKEQVTRNASFFNPDDSEKLAHLIENIDNLIQSSEKVNYDDNVKDFSVNILKLFNINGK